MSDLEMTKLCARAMGLSNIHTGHTEWEEGVGPTTPETVFAGGEEYWPLSYDPQCMAMIRQFDMTIERDDSARRIGDNRECFGVTIFVARDKRKGYDTYIVRKSPTLNRAIVECVAKMQAAKAPA